MLILSVFRVPAHLKNMDFVWRGIKNHIFGIYCFGHQIWWIWGGILEVFGRLGGSFGVSWGAFGSSSEGLDLG